jgi:sarcosine oxidase subunit alpha
MLGMGRMVSSKKDSIGAVLSRRTGMQQDERVLVGLQALNADDLVIAGAHLFTEGDDQKTETDQGWITSACHSPHVGAGIGLGYLERGDARQGEVIVAANPLENITFRVRVVSPHFVDPDGGRLRD